MNKYGWPVGITLAMLVFMGLTLAFVRKAFSERVDLVAPDYYYRDKEFSERLEKEKLLLKRGKILIERTATGVAIRLPEFFLGKKVSGKIVFYSPINPAEDFTRPMEWTGTTANFAVPLSSAHIWKISLDFTSNNEKYFGAVTLR